MFLYDVSCIVCRKEKNCFVGDIFKFAEKLLENGDDSSCTGGRVETFRVSPSAAAKLYLEHVWAVASQAIGADQSEKTGLL